jgi:very-short-patch-repair endonuclease
MTKAEHEFFKVLQEVVQDKYYIVPQVQLSNLVQVEKQERWEYTYRNKINRKSVDFVLFNKEYFTPRLVIELDDSSHLRENRRTRDNFLDEVLNKVGLKIVHIKTAHRYNINEILNLLV